MKSRDSRRHLGGQQTRMRWGSKSSDKRGFLKGFLPGYRESLECSDARERYEAKLEQFAARIRTKSREVSGWFDVAMLYSYVPKGVV